MALSEKNLIDSSNQIPYLLKICSLHSSHTSCIKSRNIPSVLCIIFVFIKLDWVLRIIELTKWGVPAKK